MPGWAARAVAQASVRSWVGIELIQGFVLRKDRENRHSEADCEMRWRSSTGGRHGCLLHPNSLGRSDPSCDRYRDTLVWLAMILVVAGVIYVMPRVANYVAAATASEQGPRA